MAETQTTQSAVDEEIAPESSAAATFAPKRRRSSMVRVVNEGAAAFDALAILAMAALAETVYSGMVINAPIDYERALGIGVIAAVSAICTFAYLKLYSSESILRPRAATLQKIIIGWVSVLIALIVIAFLTKTSSQFSRGWSIVWGVTAPAAIIIARLGVRSLAHHLIGWGNLARHVAIVGAGPIADRLASNLKLHSPELVLVGVFDDRQRSRSEVNEALILPIGNTRDLIALGRDASLDEIIVTVPLNARERLSALIDELAVLPVDIRVCPGLPVIDGSSPSITYLDDIPLIAALKRPIGEWSWMAKSILDRTGAFLGLLALAPLMFLIGLAVRLESKGPALFRQRRNGFNQEVITILKFRTMTVMEDSDIIIQAGKNDTRITRLGRFLRRSSLDELPQLINVLRGDMSLVGPRPHAIAHNSHYSKIIGHYVNRHRVKPGMTGLAQVNGFRGETDTPEKMEARVKYDLYYIENWSLILDVKIIFRTLLVVLFQRTAY